MNVDKPICVKCKHAHKPDRYLSEWVCTNEKNLPPVLTVDYVTGVKIHKKPGKSYSTTVAPDMECQQINWNGQCQHWEEKPKQGLLARLKQGLRGE